MFLLDPIKLQICAKEEFKQFIEELLGSDKVLKLGQREREGGRERGERERDVKCFLIIVGYQIDADFSMFNRAWPFISSSVLSSPKRVVDVKDFADMVSYKYSITILVQWNLSYQDILQ